MLGEQGADAQPQVGVLQRGAARAQRTFNSCRGEKSFMLQAHVPGQ